jgi:hypothetical protein
VHDAATDTSLSLRRAPAGQPAAHAGMNPRSVALAAAGLLVAMAANCVYLLLVGFDGVGAQEAVGRAIGAASAGAAAVAAGTVVRSAVLRTALLLLAVATLLLVGITPVLAVPAPAILALLSGSVRDVAAITKGFPELRARLLLLAAVALTGPPLVALAEALL